MVPANGSDGTPAVAAMTPNDEDYANTQEAKMLSKGGRRGY